MSETHLILYDVEKILLRANNEKDRLGNKLLSKGAHSLLGRFTDLTFSRDANNKTMLPGGFFPL